VKPVKKFPNIVEGYYAGARALFVRTQSERPAFDDALLREDGVLYRQFDHRKSKLAAAIAKDISQIGLKEGDVVLYLGASHGYTPTHVADMVGPSGFVMALDFAPRVVADLVLLARTRANLSPLLADARHPERYARAVMAADVLYQDVAARDQVGIFLSHLRFLAPGGFALLSLKARSIDVTKPPKQVFKEVRAVLERHITVADYRELDPFERDHAFFVCKKR
jgi:fibrillarin-like pre-rRNA processing protein